MTSGFFTTWATWEALPYLETVSLQMLFQEGGPLTHVTSVPIKGNNLEINMHTVRKSCEDEGRDWADTSASQRTSTRAGKQGTKQIFLHRSQKGSNFFSYFYWSILYLRGKSLQSCQTFCDPMDCSPPDSFVPGILQVRILAWVAMPSSRGSSQPRIVSASLMSPVLAGKFFITTTTWNLIFSVLSSSVQQSDSGIQIYIRFHILFHYGLS